ncbi:MAG: DUF3445 domain-containing protein [Planctomycetaceae bacterium]|nr:DUF3445 domain-containing protein [Planctomycetaceae bacterium]
MATPHPYRNGFSVLPNLRRIGVDEVFQTTADELPKFRKLKQEAMPLQQWHVEQDCSEEIVAAVREFFLEHSPHPLDRNGTLTELSQSVAEDFIVHRRQNEKDWMALGYVFLPSQWWPEQQIGKSFREVHEVVPGMDLTASEKLVHAMIHSGPFERFLWSPLFEERLNCHPRFPRAEFDPENPVLFMKIERQVLVGFPKLEASLFILKQSLISCDEIDHSALLKTIRSMTPEQLAYKGLTISGPKLCEWLERQTGEWHQRRPEDIG